VVECLGLSGFDFLIIDSEHGPYEAESAMDYMRAAELRNITPLVRVKDLTRASVLKMMEAGAMGLIVPFVKTPRTCGTSIDYAKYYPMGHRGVALMRPAGYGMDPCAASLDGYFEACNRETMIIPSAKPPRRWKISRPFLRWMEWLASSSALRSFCFAGDSGQFGSPVLEAAIQKVLDACKKARKFSSILALDAKTSRARLQQGFDSTVTLDSTFFLKAGQELVREAKGL
jgi:4-hydroxy-2-oxoheptanedioate aldolase